MERHGHQRSDPPAGQLPGHQVADGVALVARGRRSAAGRGVNVPRATASNASEPPRRSATCQPAGQLPGHQVADGVALVTLVARGRLSAAGRGGESEAWDISQEMSRVAAARPAGSQERGEGRGCRHVGLALSIGPPAGQLAGHRIGGGKDEGSQVAVGVAEGGLGGFRVPRVLIPDLFERLVDGEEHVFPALRLRQILRSDIGAFL